MHERRRVPRSPVHLTAKISARGSRLCDCLARDISVLGARLELRTTATLPEVFELKFDAARTTRACRVAWRAETQVGVEFLGQSIAQVA